MKLRNLILIALGIFIGYKLAAKMREDDPNVVGAPATARARHKAAPRARSPRKPNGSPGRPRPRAWTSSSARAGSLRDRMGEYENDDAVWN